MTKNISKSNTKSVNNKGKETKTNSIRGSVIVTIIVIIFFLILIIQSISISWLVQRFNDFLVLFAFQNNINPIQVPFSDIIISSLTIEYFFVGLFAVLILFIYINYKYRKEVK